MHAIFSNIGTNNVQIPLKLMIKEKNSKGLYNVIHVNCMCMCVCPLLPIFPSVSISVPGRKKESCPFEDSNNNTVKLKWCNINRHAIISE